MKKILFSLVIALVIFSYSYAQDTIIVKQQPNPYQQPPPQSGVQKRINVYAFYVFDDKFDSYYSAYDYYNGQIQDGVQYGVGLEFLLKGGASGVELLYIGRSTTAPTEYAYTGYSLRYTNFDARLDYAMLGFNRYSGTDKAQGYGGLMLGAAFAGLENPDNGNSASATKFALGLRLGGNIWTQGNIGFKLEANLLSVVQGAGGGFYFGTGGAGAGVSTYSTIVQFGLGGGIVLRFGK